MTKKSNNQKLLKDFAKFCSDNPELRFWQALAAWTGNCIIASKYASPISEAEDTFYWTEKSGFSIRKEKR